MCNCFFASGCGPQTDDLNAVRLLSVPINPFIYSAMLVLVLGFMLFAFRGRAGSDRGSFCDG